MVLSTKTVTQKFRNRVLAYMRSVIRVKWLWYDYVKTQPTPSDHLFYLFIWLL